MRHAFYVLAFVLAFAGCDGTQEEFTWVSPTPSNQIDDVEFVSGNWEPHLEAGEKGMSWGNHRAVVEVADSLTSAEALQVLIPWRRIDTDPVAKAIVVVDAASGTVIDRFFAASVTSEEGLIVFEPHAGSTVYHVYYLPWESTGSYYPTVTYPAQIVEPDERWVRTFKNDATTLAEAFTTRIESIDDFHSFFPMEIIATQEESASFFDGRDKGWSIFPEYGRLPIRMKDHIPHHWTQRADSTFSMVAQRGEVLAFQIAVLATGRALSDLTVRFEDFDERIQSGMSCINCGGIQYTGKPFTKTIDVPQGEIQPLWITATIPDQFPRGDYPGQITVTTSDGSSRTIDVSVFVLSTEIENHGYDDPASQSRLVWLNSTTGRDPDFIIDPYEPVQFDGTSLSILGRRVDLGPTGLPNEIVSYFTEEMTGTSDVAQHIISNPIEIVVDGSAGTESFTGTPFAPISEGRGRATWQAHSSSDQFDLEVNGALEYDGMLDYRITLIAKNAVSIRDISMPVHYAKDAATYMLGLGFKGQKRPTAIDWKWKIENHQEGVWIGAVNKGLQYVLRDENYVRPLNTNFYLNQPLNMPPSWFNDGKGGIRVSESDSEVIANNYSGPRALEAGDSLHFNVRFLITPFKALDTKTHFETRFVHKYVPVDSVIAYGGTVVNIHHANEINPFINYPFYNLDLQTAYIEEAHSKGIKVKLYNTIRELTYKSHELFAMRSLGGEIFNDGDGGGHSWMQEHLRGNYHAAWHAFRVDDASLLNKGTSRWTNYYIEGLSWLAANQEIDGLYLDDIAFSRETVKRMISVLHAERDEVVIDLHSANQFNERDGFTNSAMLYMEHFPFISRLWFGEYFEYDRAPDYWMTEVSGLPFGLMGEMLQDGGHPYRGMLYGMTTRYYGDVDPRPVWAMMNDFSIEDSRMLGYWLSSPPVSTGNDKIVATSFVRDNGVLLALASWSDVDESVELTLDLEALGLGPVVTWSVPEVTGLQTAATPAAGGLLTIPANQGLFVLIKDN